MPMIRQPVANKIRMIFKTSSFLIIGKALGFCVPIVVANFLNASPTADSFFLAYAVVIFLSTIFATAIEVNIVPFYIKLVKNNDTIEVRDFLGYFFIAIGVSTCVFIIAFIALLNTGVFFGFLNRSLFIALLTGITPFFVLVITSSYMVGLLNAVDHFEIGAIAPGIRAIPNMAIILLLFNHIGVWAIIVGYIVGETIKNAFLLYKIYSLNVFSIKRITLRKEYHSRIMSFVRRMSFQNLSLVIVGLKPLVDRFIGSFLDVGSVSLIEYSERLIQIPSVLIGGSILTIFLTDWSRILADRHANHSRKLLRYTLFLMGLSVSIAFILFALKNTIISIIYPNVAPKQTIALLASIYLMAFPFYVIVNFYASILVAGGHTRAIMYLAVIQQIVHISANIVLIHRFDLQGIPLASLIHAIASACLFLFVINRKVLQYAKA